MWVILRVVIPWKKERGPEGAVTVRMLVLVWQEMAVALVGRTW